MMTSFLLKEAIHFTNEQGTKLYVCFLDAVKAFDKVWLDGLIWKLRNEHGINGQILRLLGSMLTGGTGCVIWQGHYSEWFPIGQGTRQGGVLSPFLYNVYIDGLIKCIRRTNNGLQIHGVDVSSPAQADDIALVAPLKNSLQSMIDTCYAYACKWRFIYSDAKSRVVVFNETPMQYRRSSRQWQLGLGALPEVTEYVHLGCRISKFMGIKDTVKTAAQKMRGTMFATLHCDMDGDAFNPLTLVKIYKAVVLPRALYGCELWHSLSAANLKILDVAHKLCARVIQNLPPRSRSDVTLGMIGLNPIAAIINHQKMGFLGQLMRLDAKSAAKELFLVRVYQYLLNNGASQYGFIPDVLEICIQYGRSGAIQDYLETSLPETKARWKSSIKHGVNDHEIAAWNGRIQDDETLKIFAKVHPQYKPSHVWTLARKFPKHKNQLCAIVKLCALSATRCMTHVCPLCELGINVNLVQHLILDCISPHHQRENMWFRLIDEIGPTLYVTLDQMDADELIIVMLGSEVTLPDIDTDNNHTFYQIIGQFADAIWQQLPITIKLNFYPPV